VITCPLTTDDAGDSTGSTGDDKFIALEDALTQYVVDGGDGEDNRLKCQHDALVQISLYDMGHKLGFLNMMLEM